jgi:hypothetical protein
MPAVDPKKLKRLLVTEMLTPFAMKRKLSSGQLSDLVRRAMDDGRFDLSGSSDDFAHYMTEDEAADWADQLDKGGSAPHVFSTQDKPTDASTEKYGGLSEREFQRLSAEAKLRIANQVEAKRRARKN